MAILRPPNPARMGFATLPLMSAVLITAITASVVIQPVRQTSDQATDEPESFFLRWEEIGNFHGSLSSYEDGFVNFVGDHDGGELVVQQKLDDDIRFVLRESGAVEYAGGDGEIVGMSRDARVMIATELDGVEYRLEVSPTQDGRSSYALTVNGEPRRFGGPARKWMRIVFSVAEDVREIQAIHFEQLDSKGELSRKKGILHEKISQIRSEEHDLRDKISDIRSELNELDSRHAHATSSRAKILDRIRQLREEAGDADVTALEAQVAALQKEALEIAHEWEVQEPIAEARIAAIEQQIVALNKETRIAELERRISTFETDERNEEMETATRAVDPRSKAIQLLMAPKVDQLRQHHLRR